MKPQNKEVDFTFYPKKDFKECPVCGICSFPHIHRKGTFPKDFERIEPENKSTNEEYNIVSEFDRVMNKTKWIDAEDYYEIAPFLRQAQIEIERKTKSELIDGLIEWAEKNIWKDGISFLEEGHNMALEDLIHHLKSLK